MDFLALTFGLGAWVGVNGIYSQLPAIIKTDPKTWGLHFYAVVLIQVGNWGPILFVLYAKYIILTFFLIQFMYKF